MSTRLFATCGLAAGLVACGSDSTNPGTDTTTPDTTTPDTTTPDTTTPDTTPDTTTPDVTPDAGDTTPDTVGPTCSRNGFTPVAAFFEYDGDFNYTNFGVESDNAFILVEFYDVGAGSPLVGPGIYPVAGNVADQNYETCETCVLVYGDCSAGSCNKVFFGTSGTIEVTAIDQDAGTIVAKLKDFRAVEVTINDQTFRSTPVANGETWCIDSVDIVYDPECTSNAQCTDPAKPYCWDDNQTCVACLSSFDCTSAAAPVCILANDTLACGTQTNVCTGDDNLEPNNGPLQATPITPGTTVSAAACVGTTQREIDFYTFTTTEVVNATFTVTHTSSTPMDFDVLVFSERGTLVDAGESATNPEVLRINLLPAGKYYAAVYLWEGSATAAIPYTLDVDLVVPECLTNADCTEDPAKAVCNTEVGRCVVCARSFDCAAATPVCLEDAQGEATCGIVDVCVGDDMDREHNDDGPSGATPIALGQTLTSRICGQVETPSELESDFFVLDLTAAGNVRVTLSWEGTSDLDLFLFDEDGTFLDGSVEAQPEVISAPNLAIGKYYIEVWSYDGNPTDAIAYTLGTESY